jgi:phosphoserine phosphatase
MKKMNPGMMAIMAKKKNPMAKKEMPMKKGGMPMVMKDGKKVPAFAADSKGKMAKGGMAHSDMAKDKPMMKKVATKAVKGHEKRLHGMAKGGGIEIKGKTKGRMV